MPVAFPSHQGLVLPVVRWFSGRIDVVALCVGAAMPDIVDGAAWPFRGELGQWLGHSLLGLLACVPVGLALSRIARRYLPRTWLARLDQGAPPSSSLVRAASVGIGALSHLFFDLVTHGNFRLLWPWYVNDHAFPSWWYHRWGSIPLPVYREPYPFAPHTIAWFIMTVLGAVIFVRYVRMTKADPE